MDYRAVIEHFGGGSLTKAADALDMPKQTIHQWKTHGIPFEKQFILQMKSKGRLKAEMPMELRRPRKRAA